MELETLVSSVNQDVKALAGKMNLQTKAIIINQCEKMNIANAEKVTVSIVDDLENAKRAVAQAL